MIRTLFLACVLFSAAMASAQQPQVYQPIPQPLYQVVWVMRPAWPFGFRYVLRPVLVPVYPQQQQPL